MTRLAIAADLHVDQYGSRRDPETGLNVRELDALRTTAWVAAQARELECDALVVAGDYVEAKVNPRSGRVTRIARSLEQGPDRQIHVLGNHDVGDGGVTIVEDLATRADAWTGHTAPDVVQVGGVAVCVIPFLSPAWLRTQPGFEAAPDADVFRILGEQYLAIARGLYVRAADAGLQAILVGHQQLAGGMMNERQASFLDRKSVV